MNDATARDPWIDPTVLDLSGSHPIANGHVRDVFVRPKDPDFLLKRARRNKWQDWANRRGIIAWMKRRRPDGPYRSFIKEYHAYVHAANMAERLGRPIPIAEFGGIVRTESGLAQVATRVSDGKGGLAPTLKQLSLDGRLDEALVEKLNTFVADIYALNVVAPDLNQVNIVFDSDGPSARFLLIDGYGDKSWLPLRALFPRLNARTLDRRFRRMSKLPQLEWSPRDRRFAFRRSQAPRQIQPPPKTRVPPTS